MVTFQKSLNKDQKITKNLKRSFRTSFKAQNIIKDKNQPGLHRFELRSCKILIVEQTIFLNYCT